MGIRTRSASTPATDSCEPAPRRMCVRATSSSRWGAGSSNPSGFPLMPLMRLPERPSSSRPQHACPKASGPRSWKATWTIRTVYRNGSSACGAAARAMRENHRGFPSYLLVAPHGAFCVLDRLGTVLASANAHRVLDSDDEDLAVADLTVPGPPGHGELVDDRRHDLRLHDRLDFQARPERDVHRGSAIFLRVASLGAATFDLRHRHARHAALVQHVLDLLQPFVTDDRDDHLHVESAPVRRHAADTSFCFAGTASPLGCGCGLTVGVSAGR